MEFLLELPLLLLLQLLLVVMADGWGEVVGRGSFLKAFCPLAPRMGPPGTCCMLLLPGWEGGAVNFEPFGKPPPCMRKLALLSLAPIGC